MTTTVAPFLLVYRVSYFFTEFDPNMTTFVMSREHVEQAKCPVGRTAGAGSAAGRGMTEGRVRIGARSQIPKFSRR
jgi:MFS transporter, PHS family, inorganic phosphate transporter